MQSTTETPLALRPWPRARVPFAPLERAVARHGGLAATLRTVGRPGEGDTTRIVWRLRRAWNRGKRLGFLTPAAADLLTVRLLRLVPHVVWADWEQLELPERESSGNPR